MKMKKLLFTTTFLLILSSLFGQELQIPNDYKLEKAEDYDLYEQLLVDCVDWLINNPLEKNVEKRKEVNAFLLKWLTGSPKLHLELKQEIVTFTDSNPELLLIFLGGWAKYSLESGDIDNKIKGNIAGIESVIDFYKKNKKVIGKDKAVEKYIKIQKKGKLKNFIEKNI